MPTLEKVEHRSSPSINSKAEHYRRLDKPAEVFLEHLYGGCELESKTNQKNFALLRERLERGSAIAYFNHPTLSDGPIIIGILLKELAGSARIIGGPQSQKHYDFLRDPGGALMTRLAPLLGVELFPVVQHYDRQSYSEEMNAKLLKEFVRMGKKILGQPGGVMMIAPEGTRSDGGELRQAQTGIEHLERFGRKRGKVKTEIPISFFPIAIIPDGEFDQESNFFGPADLFFSPNRDTFNENFNFRHGFKIKTGPPFSAEELRQEMPEDVSFSDALMKLKLAPLLPPEMRGVYAPFVSE